MNRQLILISNPGNPNANNYAPETFLAIERWKSFFQSPIGGYWQDEEISIYDEHHPISSDEFSRIVMVLDTVQCDYSVIVFCGHGCSTLDQRDAIQLPIPTDEDNKLFPVDDLKGMNGANIRRTLILDACRSIVPFTSQQLFEQRQYSEIYIIDGIECRKYYNSLIMDANPHVELLQSTNLHQRAYGSATGSVYADTVLSYVNQNSINWKRRALMNPYGQFCFSMGQIHNEIYGNMIQQGRQIPEYNCSNHNSASFPFAAMHLPNERNIHNDNAIIEVIDD